MTTRILTRYYQEYRNEAVLLPKIIPMKNAGIPVAVHAALNDASRPLLGVSDDPRLSVAEQALLRATAVLHNALVLTDPNLPDNPIIYANPAFLELSGYPEAEIVGFNCRFLQGPRTDCAEVARLRDAIREQRPVQVTLLNYRKDGTSFWNELTVSPVRDDVGALTHFIAVQTDVTTLKETEAELAESERRLRLALASGKLGAWHLDLATDRLLEASDIWRSHFGLAPDGVVTLSDVYQAIHPDDRDLVRRERELSVSARKDYQAEYRVVWPDGTIHWISAQGTLTFTESGEPRHLIGVAQEITARKQQEAQQETALREALERADQDQLTGLPNHRVFQKRLDEETARAHRDGTTLAVVMLDVDNFRFFNDVYGHFLGDEVLRQTAERLQAVCRPYDAVARFGGDEFALLLPGIEQTTLPEIEARLRANLSDLSFRPPGQETVIPVTVSVGAALLSALSMDWHEALQRAEERLLRSKTGGEADTEATAVRASAIVQVAEYSMLDALVTAVDNKDRYTRKHSEDVMAYSLMITREMGLDAGALHTVAVAALLHDVGKIGVPDAVLRKPGKLTEEEFATVRQHPTMGAALVSTVPGLEDTLDAVRHHHERWDGRGYPAGLRGEECPQIARLMAVADAYSAMTTDRPYRSGMVQAKALSILEEGAGTQWDPDCVQAFLNALAHQQSAGVKA